MAVHAAPPIRADALPLLRRSGGLYFGLILVVAFLIALLLPPDPDHTVSALGFAVALCAGELVALSLLLSHERSRGALRRGGAALLAGGLAGGLLALGAEGRIEDSPWAVASGVLLAFVPIALGRYGEARIGVAAPEQRLPTRTWALLRAATQRLGLPIRDVTLALVGRAGEKSAS